MWMTYNTVPYEPILILYHLPGNNLIWLETPPPPSSMHQASLPHFLLGNWLYHPLNYQLVSVVIDTMFVPNLRNPGSIPAYLLLFYCVYGGHRRDIDACDLEFCKYEIGWG